MTYSVTLSGQTFTVDPSQNGQQMTLLLDGHSYTIDWQPLISLWQQDSGRGSLLVNGRSYDVFCRRLVNESSGGQNYEIILAGKRLEVFVENEQSKKLASIVKSPISSGIAQIKAPMPGLVVQLPFEVGATVEAGQVVAILEAMKMENDLSSPINGVVKELRVTAGQTVDQGQVLVILESPQS